VLRRAPPDVILALAAGAVLALMIDFNSLLARHSSPLFASWTAHGIGAVAALGLVLWRRGARPVATVASPKAAWPRWIYLGGVPGALTVLLAAVTVNGPLGFSGTLALMLAGQMLFGVVADRFGWLGLARRTPTSGGLAGLGLVLAGSLVVIVAGR
jgi:transporter family-2 protein